MYWLNYVCLLEVVPASDSGLHQFVTQDQDTFLVISITFPQAALKATPFQIAYSDQKTTHKIARKAEELEAFTVPYKRWTQQFKIQQSLIFTGKAVTHETVTNNAYVCNRMDQHARTYTFTCSFHRI